jgi:Cys-tRNA(Pro)/Cys-tRNA(Cys) deacylase
LPRHRGAATPALEALKTASIPYRVLEYEHDPRSESFGHEAVRKLGLDATAVCKTLMTDVDGVPVTAVVPIASQLRLKSLAGALGAKQARMLDPATAQRVTGYVVGGISPLGQRRPHTCVVDASVTHLPLVYVSGGRRGLTIEIAPADLVRTLNAHTAAITTT